MKKIIFLLFTLAICFQVNAQERTYDEASIGITYTSTTFSEGYEYGVGVIVVADSNISGLGFGSIIELNYLEPSDIISNTVDYGLKLDVSLKYDLELLKGFEIAPTAGIGVLSAQSELDSNTDSTTDFYFSAGGTSSLFIGKNTILGFHLSKPFLEDADLSMSFSLRIQL